jgi:hypothetical protein
LGRKDFVMADYKPPREEAKIKLPSHVVVKIK